MTQPEQGPIVNAESGNVQGSEVEISNGTTCECGAESVTNVSSNNGTSSGNNCSGKTSYSQIKKRNSKKKREKGKVKVEIEPVEVPTEPSPTLPTPKSSWLLRLFESKLCDMAIAIAYVFKSKESGVLAYLGNKLFVS